jgi:hypothetical protein
VQAKIADMQGKAIRERRVEDPSDYLSRLGCANVVKDMVVREERNVRRFVWPRRADHAACTHSRCRARYSPLRRTVRARQPVPRRRRRRSHL